MRPSVIISKLVFFSLIISFCLDCKLLGQERSSANNDYVAIDNHVHYMSPENWQALDSEDLLEHRPINTEVVFEHMQNTPIKRVVALSSGYRFNNSKEKMMHENNFVANEANRYPGKVIPFCGVPMRPDWALGEIVRCMKDLNMEGLKIHPTASGVYGEDFDKKNTIVLFDDIYALINSLQIKLKRPIPILVDTNWWPPGEKSYEKMFAFVKKYPEVPTIWAHALSFDWEDGLTKLATEIKEFPQLYKNLLIDLSAIPVMLFNKDIVLTDAITAPAINPEKFVMLLRKVGIEKFVFGSDFPFISAQETLDVLEQYPFTQKELSQIINNNYYRIKTPSVLRSGCLNAASRLLKG